MNRKKTETAKACSKRRKTGHSIYAAFSAALPERAAFVAQQLSRVNLVFRELFSDENFLTLLKAESLTMIPVYLRRVLDETKTGHDIA